MVEQTINVIEAQAIPKRLVTKKNRIPFHKKKHIRVDDKQKKGYHLHCFTDANGKVEKAREAGYEFIPAAPGKESLNATDASRFGKVMCQSVGQGQVGYMMRIPLEWWEEDQRSKQKVLDDKDKVLGVDKLPPEARHCFRGSIKVDNSRK